MFNSVLCKDLIREIIRSKAKFFSIIFMLGLGIFVSVGMKITSPIMKETILSYMKDTEMYDYKISKSDSITKNQYDKIAKLIKYKSELVLNSPRLVNNKNIELTIQSIPQISTKPIITMGSQPKNDNDIVLDSRLSKKFKIGDKVELIDFNAYGDLKNESFTITGFANNIEDIINNEYDDKSDNFFKGFAYILSTAFNDKARGSIFLKSNLLDKKPFDSIEYKNTIKNEKQKMYDILNDLSENEFNKNKTEIENKKTILDDSKYKIKFALKNAENISEDKIVELKNKLDDIEKNIGELNKYESLTTKKNFRIYTRYDSTAYNFYESANKLNVVSNVFSGFFFLIATLVSLTTMIRMVEEHRIQIGTMKALGYGNIKIAQKFFIYGSLASTIGIVMGLIVAHTIIVGQIFNAYAKSYIIPDYKLHFYPQIILLYCLIAYMCTTFSAYIAVQNMLKTRVSNLLRGKIPKAGTSIFLEKIKFIWKRMNFFRKVTARNIFRYKARMWMTILGISGCTGLLFLGFALRNSVHNIEKRQYDELFKYDLILGIDPSKDIDKLNDYLYNAKIVNDKIDAYIENAMFTGVDNNNYNNVQVVISDDLQKMIDFNDMNNKSIHIDNDGAFMSVKLSHISHSLKGADIELNILGESQSYKVSNIFQNYIGHSIYLTKKYYEKINGKLPYNNAIIVRLNKKVGEVHDFIQKLYSFNAIVSIDDVSGYKDMLANISNSMSSVIWVMVICSIFLAFVVLYNLTNINISERNMELSTIKVLGMYSKEVTAYVYRETLLLTILGQFMGILMGISMFKYVVWELPPKTAFINIGTRVFDYLLAIVITFFITLAISIPIHFKLKNVNMVEALKAIE